MDWAAEFCGTSRQTCRLYLSHFLRHRSRHPRVFDDDIEFWVDNFMQPGALQGGFNWNRSIAEERRRSIVGEAPAPQTIQASTHVLWGRHGPVLRSDWTEGLAGHFSDLTV